MSTATAAIVAVAPHGRSIGKGDPVIGIAPVSDLATAVAGGSAVVIDVLANDGVADRTAVTIVLNTSGAAGTGIAVNIDNNVTYTPPATAQGDTFTYTIDGSAPATVTVQVQDPPGDALAVSVMALDPVGYWRHGDVQGTGALLDSSGEGNNGTISGTPTFGVNPGLASPTNLNRAIDYGGVASASIPVTALAEVTYALRFKLSAATISGNQWIVHRNQAGNNAGNWALRPQRLFFQNGSTQLNIDIPGNLFAAGRWYHAFIRMDAAAADLTVNNVVIGSVPHTIGEIGTVAPLVIAEDMAGARSGVTMHELVRYDRRLTNAEIAARSFFDAVDGADPLAGTSLPAMTGTLRNVSNQTQLDAACGVANPGDHIVLAYNTYTTIRIDRAGTAAAPIVIRAANLLQAVVTGSPSFISNDNVTVYGIDFTRSIIGGFTPAGSNKRASRLRLWRCRFRDGSGIAIRLYDAPDFDGAYCQVGPNWEGRGFLFSISRGSLRHVWRYSMFRDPPSGWVSNGDGEAMHYGDSSQALFVGGLVHRCKFKNWNVSDESELISIKSSANLVRQCCAEGCNLAFNIRFGHSNTFEGCWTKNSVGFGARDGWDVGEGKQNKILGCIVENPTDSSRGIYSLQGDWLPPDNRPAGGHFPVSRNLVISGCTGPVNAGRTVSSLNINPRNVRIRQHSGTINLGVNENPDSQPGVAETLYEWSSPIWLEDDDVGPLAAL